MTLELEIVTADGVEYKGEADSVQVRSTVGDVTIRPRHINYVTTLGMGQAIIVMDGTKRKAACMGGMLTVTDGKVKLVPTTFEWQENIDFVRAHEAQAKAEARLQNKDASKGEITLAEAKLKRALVRQSLEK